jgi:hypothetical protein
MEGEKKKYKDRKLKSHTPIYCDIPGCVDANRDMNNKYALSMHQHYKHGIGNFTITNFASGRKTKVSDIKEDTNTVKIDEVKNIQSPIEHNTDLVALGNKLDNIAKMIPTNFCEEFPHLCTLGKRVEDLEGKINEVKEAIPKKITVNIPKQQMPEIPVPTIDIDGLSNKLVNSISPQLKFDLEPLTKVLSEGISSLKDVLTPKEIADIEKEQKIVDEVIKEDPILEEMLHKSPEDYFNCPECRQKLLDSLEKRILGNKDKDPEIVNFLNNIKSNIISMNEGDSHGHEDGTRPERSNTDTTTTDEGGSKEQPGDSKPEPNPVYNATEEDKPADTKSDAVESATESTKPATAGNDECSSGWCLLRRKRRD